MYTGSCRACQNGISIVGGNENTNGKHQAVWNSENEDVATSLGGWGEDSTKGCFSLCPRLRVENLLSLQDGGPGKDRPPQHSQQLHSQLSGN